MTRPVGTERAASGKPSVHGAKRHARGAGCTEDHRESAFDILAEVLGQDRIGLLRASPRNRERSREEPREASGGDHAHDYDADPESDNHDAPADDDRASIARA